MGYKDRRDANVPSSADLAAAAKLYLLRNTDRKLYVLWWTTWPFMTSCDLCEGHFNYYWSYLVKRHLPLLNAKGRTSYSWILLLDDKVWWNFCIQSLRYTAFTSHGVLCTAP